MPIELDKAVAVHADVTLGGGSDPALSLSGQQLTLADVLTPTEHTAIGSSTPHHAQDHAHAGGAGDSAVDHVNLSNKGTNTHATIDTHLAAVGGQTHGVVIVDTKANILAAVKTAGTLAYATDTLELLVSNGTTWELYPFAAVAELQVPDMGYHQHSSRIGIGTDYITDKRLSNCEIGENANTTQGSIRVTESETIDVYLSGTWERIVTNFRFREDADRGYMLEHKPVGLTEWIELMSGNGITLGLNGLPLIQQYTAGMGAYPTHVKMDGGAF